MLSAKSKSILMFFPWNGTHPQDAFAAAPVVYFTHDISPEGQGFEARDTSGGTTRSVWRQR